MGSAGVGAFYVPNGKTITMEVFAVTNDQHVHQFMRTGGTWTNLDLSASFGPLTDSAFGGMAAFRTAPNNQFHVYYAPTAELYQLYFNGTSWTYNDLSNRVGTASSNGVAGFSLGNLQYVYYIAN